MLRKDREMEREARASRGEEPSSSSGGGPGPPASLRDDNSDEDELIGPPVPSVAITEDTIGERFREMREQWTRQEAANMEKDSVHYSDVLFDGEFSFVFVFSFLVDLCKICDFFKHLENWNIEKK